MQIDNFKNRPNIPWRSRERKNSGNVPRLRRITYSGIISSFALLLSVTSFYYSNLREHHSIKYVVSRISIEPSKRGVYFLMESIFSNHGNKTETISSVSAAISFSGERPDLVRLRPSGLDQGPFVLKPSDSTIIRNTSEITAAQIDQFRNSIQIDGKVHPNKFDVRFYIISTDADGLSLMKNEIVGILAYAPEKKEWSFSSTGTWEEKVFELFAEQTSTH
jgi:hypothetical protein